MRWILFNNMSTQTEQQKQTSNPLQPGTTAPNFTLRTTPDKSVSLDQFKGNPVILLFYPADFSPVCGDEVSLYNEILPEFQRLNADVIGILVDKDGIIRYSYVSPIGVNPGADGILKALESLPQSTEQK